MKAQEFRLGNLINSKELDLRNGSERIDAVEVDTYVMFELIRGNITGKYSPIPLTEEWLLKFDWFRITTDKRYTFRDIEYYSISESGSLYFGLEYTATDIKYVHQLQNLYFALIGTELTIK